METLTKISHLEQENFITVVSVGPDPVKTAASSPTDLVLPIDTKSGFVTVLTIGDDDSLADYNKDVIEEVLVYRLPGERLGFGLKFEGGTKANEFVKRLFIQSCAPDSPASRVQSTWGNLTEGDEVLEIDCIPVDTMTRIDCVRCLKESNVVIKLLVKHSYEKNDKNKLVEDLPQVVSAEKKRTPPPPPPVPPRKIPKKFYKKQPNENQDNPIPAVRHNVNNNNIGNTSAAIKSKKFQSPQSSGRSSYSPDISRRDRRYSDGSLGPPNAEVYIDLFSQESTLSLSESDDTGSSISTVVDRFASFPTTTTSSLAGSLPSTPTSVQKHLDFSNLIYDDEEFSHKFTNNNNNCNKINVSIVTTKTTENNEKPPSMNGDDSSPLQPPSCFQDAPLSYGNEEIRLDSKSDDVFEPLIVAGNERKLVKKPPVPPRSRDFAKHDVKEIHDENMNISNLPRLVDFVPKTRECSDNSADIINEFLNNERRQTDNSLASDSWFGCDDFSNEIDLYSSKWSLSSQLATIGEVEEEGSPDFDNNRSTPIVIVENADADRYIAEIGTESTKEGAAAIDKEINGKMETLPSDSRQPPDGHEFPDYIEASPDSGDFTRQNYCSSYQLNIESKMTPYSVNSSHDRSSFNDFSNVPIQNNPLNKMNSVSNSDLSSMSKTSYENGDEVQLKRPGLEPTLHTRSQSLIDMSTISKEKNDRWSVMVEQRRKSLSKLKGLVIPEHVSENEVTSPVSVYIPVIISNTPSITLETKIENNLAHHNNKIRHSSEIELFAPPLASPPWASTTTSLPKYSPAFKRKSLQVYPSKPKSDYEPARILLRPTLLTPTDKISKSNNDNHDLGLDNLSDAPKSLESITSPTRSDCSFDYLTSTFKTRTKHEFVLNRANKTELPYYVAKLHKDLGKSEDESDNDSAVSSSQSSYISRCSPPPSPTRSVDTLDHESSPRKHDTTKVSEKYSNLQSRLLKAASVEAINRKNILASAKCRSGRDIKVGSPVIQRKYEENGETVSPPISPSSIVPENIAPEPEESDDIVISYEKITEDAVILPEEPVQPTVVKMTEITNISNETSEESASPLKLPPIPISVARKTDRSPIVPVNNRRSSGSSTLRTDSQLNPSPRTTSTLRNEKSMSVTDLRKSFEKFGSAPAPHPHPQYQSPTPRVNAKKCPEPEIKNIESKPNSSGKNYVKAAKIQPKIKAIAKTDEKGKIVEEPVIGTNRRKIVLSPKFIGGSIGITLAGGTDYEIKEITVHKIRHGSVAQIDGQLKKGDRIISINGETTAGKTHAESVEMLKEPVSKFILIVEDGKDEAVTSPNQRRSFTVELKSPITETAPLEVKNVTHVVSLIKDGPGLGFSMEGGKDSPQGDLPLTVKKIFQGGPAEKSADLFLGDEILAINYISVINMTKIEVWNLMKKLSDGNVSIHIHR